MFSNEFDIRIFYVFNVAIIKIIFKKLFIKSNPSFLKFMISNFVHYFLLFTFFI